MLCGFASGGTRSPRPLQAANEGHAAVARTLLARGANPSPITTGREITPMHLAAEFGRWSILNAAEALFYAFV
jgi:ankyrin repeat protein